MGARLNEKNLAMLANGALDADLGMATPAAIESPDIAIKTEFPCFEILQELHKSVKKS